MKNSLINIEVHPFQAYAMADGLRLKVCTDMMCAEQIGLSEVRSGSPFSAIEEYLMSNIPEIIKKFDGRQIAEFDIAHNSFAEPEWELNIRYCKSSYSIGTYRLTLSLRDKASDKKYIWSVWRGWDYYDLRKEGVRENLIEMLKEGRAFIEEHSNMRATMGNAEFFVGGLIDV